MKSYKSLKNITIVTDRKVQHDIMNCRSPSSNVNTGLKTCISQGSSNFFSANHIPASCKSMAGKGQQNCTRSRSISTQKHKRQRSSSVQHQQNSQALQQTRKKEQDYYCLQKIINQFKKFLIEKQQKWDLSFISYNQLIKLLWLCRYVSYATQQQFIQNNQQSELKKVYLLWASISTKKYIKYYDFLNFVQIIENINVQGQRVLAVLHSLQTQLNALCFKQYDRLQQDPNFSFFIKRIDLKRESNNLIIQSVKQKILSQFKSFKLHKLKDSGINEYIKMQQQQVIISKKSCELAEQKRKKIQSKIKQTKPHIQNINLIDLLSYRQRDHVQTPKKCNAPVKKINKFKKDELKKQIQFLSRPKTYFEQRRQDQVVYYREQEQFTFHPKVNPCKINGKQKIMQIKNVDKMLVRMKQARKIKQEKETIIKKGWNSFNKFGLKISNKKNNDQGNYQQNQSYQINKENIDIQKKDNSKAQVLSTLKQSQIVEKNVQKSQNYRQSKAQKYQVSKDYLRIPILYIDVNIQQGKKQRIIIYDNDKAQDLAKQFGQKHKLTQETISRLQQLLQQQMDTILARIQQETDDECSILY